MRDVAVTFDSEREFLRRLVAPFFEGAFLQQLVESSVDLNARETFRTKPQPLFLWRIAVKPVAPAFVIPTAGADMCFARPGP